MPNQAPLNTKPVGLAGLLLVGAGIFAPSLAASLHASPDIVHGLERISDYFIGGGSVGAYFGMPFTVKT